MATLNIKWSEFEVVKKHDVDRDKPYLWVFGIILDADTVKSREFIVRKTADSTSLGGKKFKKGETSAVPSTLDITKEIKPFLGMETAGVIVLAWENATTKDSVITSAYRAAADMINNFINDVVTKALDDILAGKPADELDVEPSAMDIAGLEEDIRETVSDTIRSGSGLFQAIPDHDIGSGFFLANLAGPVEQRLTFPFVKRTTHYVLEGDFTYDIPAPKPGRLPPAPPPKHQEPKPQARTRARR